MGSAQTWLGAQSSFAWQLQYQIASVSRFQHVAPVPSDVAHCALLTQRQPG